MEANWLHRTPEEARKLADILSEKGVPETVCPVCGETAWDVGQDTLVLLNPEPRGLEVLPVSCSNCGFTRLHSTRHLLSP